MGPTEYTGYTEKKAVERKEKGRRGAEGRVADPALRESQGEGVDALADGGEAVAAGGREILEQVEGGQGIGLVGGDFGGRTVVEKIGEEDDEAAHERRIGVGVKVQSASAEFGGEPDGGNTAQHAVGVDAGFGRQRRVTAGPVDDEGQAFLEVVDGGEVVDEGLEFGGEGHGGRKIEVAARDGQARARNSRARGAEQGRRVAWEAKIGFDRD